MSAPLHTDYLVDVTAVSAAAAAAVQQSMTLVAAALEAHTRVAAFHARLAERAGR